eukprot:gene810-898_t
MPIITPAFPAMNSAFNVNTSQLTVLQTELKRGEGLLKSRPSLSDENLQVVWGELFSSSKRDYYSKYPRYLQLDFVAQKSSRFHYKWFQWCESKLRNLFIAFEQQSHVICHPHTFCEYYESSVTDIRTYAKWVARPRHASSAEDLTVLEKFGTSAELHVFSYVLGLSFTPGLRSIDISPPLHDFVELLLNWNECFNDDDYDVVAHALTRDQTQPRATLPQMLAVHFFPYQRTQGLAKTPRLALCLVSRYPHVAKAELAGMILRLSLMRPLWVLFEPMGAIRLRRSPGIVDGSEQIRSVRWDVGRATRSVDGPLVHSFRSVRRPDISPSKHFCLTNFVGVSGRVVRGGVCWSCMMKE